MFIEKTQRISGPAQFKLLLFESIVLDFASNQLCVLGKIAFHTYKIHRKSYFLLIICYCHSVDTVLLLQVRYGVYWLSPLDTSKMRFGDTHLVIVETGSKSSVTGAGRYLWVAPLTALAPWVLPA